MDVFRCVTLGKSMLVSFLVLAKSYFPCGRILVSILHIFGPIYRLVILTFLSLRINKIESLNFSLVLEKTL